MSCFRFNFLNLTGCAPCDPVNRLNIQMVNGAELVRLLDRADSWWMACSNANEIQIYPIKSINRMLASINSLFLSRFSYICADCSNVECIIVNFSQQTHSREPQLRFTFSHTKPICTYTRAHNHTDTRTTRAYKSTCLNACYWHNSSH